MDFPAWTLVALSLAGALNSPSCMAEETILLTLAPKDGVFTPSGFSAIADLSQIGQLSATQPNEVQQLAALKGIPPQAEQRWGELKRDAAENWPAGSDSHVRALLGSVTDSDSRQYLEGLAARLRPFTQIHGLATEAVVVSKGSALEYRRAVEPRYRNNLQEIARAQMVAQTNPAVVGRLVDGAGKEAFYWLSLHAAIPPTEALSQQIAHRAQTLLGSDYACTYSTGAERYGPLIRLKLTDHAGAFRDPKRLADVQALERELAAAGVTTGSYSLAGMVGALHSALHAEEATPEAWPSSANAVSQMLLLYESTISSDLYQLVSPSFDAVYVSIWLQQGPDKLEQLDAIVRKHWSDEMAQRQTVWNPDAVALVDCRAADDTHNS